MSHARVLDKSGRLATVRHFAHKVEDVLVWERRHGPLPRPGAVLALTGWAERIHDHRRYPGLDDMHAARSSPHRAGQPTTDIYVRSKIRCAVMPPTERSDALAAMSVSRLHFRW